LEKSGVQALISFAQLFLWQLGHSSKCLELIYKWALWTSSFL